MVEEQLQGFVGGLPVCVSEQVCVLRCLGVPCCYQRVV